MRGRGSRGFVALTIVAALGAAAATPAAAKTYTGTIDETSFVPKRPDTRFTFKTKGNRARFTRLGLALECTPDNRRDPRLLVTVKTPLRRMQTIVGSRSYSFKGTVSSPAGRIKLDVGLGLTPFVGNLSARMGGCRDSYVDFNRRR